MAVSELSAARVKAWKTYTFFEILPASAMAAREIAVVSREKKIWSEAHGAKCVCRTFWQRPAMNIKVWTSFFG